VSRTSHKLRLLVFFAGITFLLFNPIFFTQFNGKNPQIQSQIQIVKQPNSGKNYVYIRHESEIMLAESTSEVLSVDSQIFGNYLLEEIKHSNEKVVDVLVVFGKDKSLSDRLSLLEITSLEYTLKKQYKNFPIALIEVSLEDLRQSKEELSSMSGIKRLFLDSSHEFQHQNLPSSSILVDEDNWWLDAIGATDLSFDGSGVRIAILDTGIYSDHADFASKTPITTHINFASDEGFRNSSEYQDIHGHGTHVAGIAAGTGTSSSGKYIGVAPGASLLNVKTLNDYGGITDSDVIDAVDWIITQDNADIISMSFQTEFQSSIYNPIAIALESASEHGIIPVAAAGNDGPLHLSGIHPGTVPSVISVGAINRDLEITSFSSVGPSYMSHVIPDVLAPGHEIIAPESLNSLIGYSERYTNSQIEGSQPSSDYFAISGTSMATPMVSGAIALILDAYPDLTPEGVRAALYQGAYLPDHYEGMYGANGIGSGIINVSASIDWLDSLGDTSSIVQAYPDKLPYEPVDLLAYPGDSQIFNISIFSAKNTSTSLEITIPVSSNVILTPTTSSLSFTNHSVQHVQFELKILENASVGLETGSILINDTGTGELLEQIDYAIEISYPKGRAYFDSLHGLNDLYPEWPSGYSQIEIYEAMKILHENGYQLVYEMENWTKNTQPQLKSHLLSLDLLSTVDIVVLQTPVLAYTDIEIEALKNYLAQGGSMLLLGTRFETMPINSLNSLLTQLNTGISINNENIFDYTDVGFGYVLDKYSVSEINPSSPIFETGDEFSYWYGATLETNSYADSIASLQNNTIVAAHESDSGGKVVVWSDYHWLRNDIFGQENGVDHQRILVNLFDYMNHQDENDYMITANFNSSIQTEGDLELHLSILNASTDAPVSDRTYGSTLNASIISPSEVYSQLELKSLGNGIYSNTTFSLATPDYRPYILQINVSSPNGIITKEYVLYRINETSTIQIGDPYISDVEITRSPGSNTIIQYTGTSPGLTSKLYGSLTTESFYSENTIQEYIIGLSPSGIQYSHTFTISGDESSGLFVFFATASSSNNFTNFEVTRSLFRIENHIPEINEEDSYFNTIPFEDTRTETSMYILSASNNRDLDLTVKVEELIGYEDNPEDLYVISYYTAAASAGSTFDIIYPNSIPTSILTYNSDLEQFEGQFDIPSRLYFSGASGSVEVSQQSKYPEDIIYFSVLWLTIRDSDGGTEDYLILMYVNVVFDWADLLEYLPIIITVLALMGIAVTIFVIAKKRRKKRISHSPYHEIRSEKAYCMYCGKQISTTYLVCPHCGKQLP